MGFRAQGTLLVALAVPLAALPAVPRQAPAPTGAACQLSYQRADNMWSTVGNMNWESVSLETGQSRAFVTDWKYEKTLNDGATYYGSHLRAAHNQGTVAVQMLLKVDPVNTRWRTIYPTQKMTALKADLVEVRCAPPE